MSEDREQKVVPLNARAGSFEDLEVFRRAYRVSLGRASDELGVPCDRAAGDGRSGAPGVEVDLRQHCRRVLHARVVRRRTSADIWRWRLDRRTRCGCGAAIVWILATSTKRCGRHGATNIRR